MGSYLTFCQVGSFIASQMRYAFSRHSSSQSGSFFFLEISLTTSSFNPFGIVSASTSVTKPYLYSRVASSSIVCVDVDIRLRSIGLSSCLPQDVDRRRYSARPAGPSESHRKRSPAPARRFCVRVIEHKPTADERRVVVERGALDELITLRIDEHLRAFRAFEDVIAGARCALPGERVAQTRTSTRFDGDAKSAIRNAVPGGHFLDQRCGVIADMKHGLRSSRVVQSPSDIRPVYIYDQNSPILVPCEHSAQGGIPSCSTQLKS